MKFLKKSQTQRIIVRLACVLLLSVLLLSHDCSAEQMTYTHSGFFNDSNKSEPKITHGENVIFEYMYGFAGDYKLLNKYYDDWSAWTYGGNPPTVSSWYIGATTENDGVIAFVSPEKTAVKIGSSLKLKIEDDLSEQCDGAGFMIIQQRGSGFYPLWPERGKWGWVDIKESGETELPEITTQLEKGDRLLFVAHCIGDPTGDTVVVDPTVSLIDAGIAPGEFTEWQLSETPAQQDADSGIYKHSAFFSDESVKNGQFSYRGGYNGEYTTLTTFREDWGAWTYGGSPPSIGSYFMGGTVDNDAVLAFTAPEGGEAEISSEIPILLPFGEQSDGASLIIVLKNQNGEHPLWPKDGEWEYQTLTSATKLELSGVKVYMKKGDELHFICRSTGSSDYDTVEIAPVIRLDTTAEAPESEPENVERIYYTYEDYIALLPDRNDLKIDPPCGAAESDNNVVLPANVVIICIVVCAVLAVGVVTATLIIKKRKAKTVEEKQQ